MNRKANNNPIARTPTETISNIILLLSPPFVAPFVPGKSPIDGGILFPPELSFDSFTEKVDRSVWNILPQDMTPCYYPTDNSINIPVAALEEPYFSLQYSDEKNLGAIGTIIGHEVTHAFDDLGSQYDENGDMVDWWTSEDRKAFNDRSEKIVTYYTSYKTPGTMQQDGQQTLGENIADLGSMNCLTRIVEHNGLNAENFFESYANIWASTMDGLSAAIFPEWTSTLRTRCA